MYCAYHSLTAHCTLPTRPQQEKYDQLILQAIDEEEKSEGWCGVQCEVFVE
jgi:hypothetical protein